MALVSVLFPCCARGRNRKKRRASDLDEEQLIPDESSRLIPPGMEPESSPTVPDILVEAREKKKARLGIIVRAKEGNMINTSVPAPFNVLNRPNRYSPQRYGTSAAGASNSNTSRSLSRSASRGPPRSVSVVRYGQYPHGYGYGAVGISYNHTFTPAPLEPESSEVQVQIASAAEGRRTLERSGSSSNRKGSRTAATIDTPTGRIVRRVGESSGLLKALPNAENNDDSPQPQKTSESHLRPLEPVVSPNERNSASSSSEPGNNREDSRNPDPVPVDDLAIVTPGQGLGVRLVHPPSPNTGMGRRGRLKVKPGGHIESPISNSDSDNQNASTILGTSVPAVTAPPPSPHSDASRSSDSETEVNPNTVPDQDHKEIKFEIKDIGEVTVGWDD
jgi:hypothetical protein